MVEISVALKHGRSSDVPPNLPDSDQEVLMTSLVTTRGGACRNLADRKRFFPIKSFSRRPDGPIQIDFNTTLASY